MLPVTETPVFQAFSALFLQECVSRQTVSMWHEEKKQLIHTCASKPEHVDKLELSICSECSYNERLTHRDNQ